jgi:hypothetical protein
VGNWNRDDPKWTPEILRKVNLTRNRKFTTDFEDSPVEAAQDENEFWMSY